jgi:hypothetical protein
MARGGVQKIIMKAGPSEHTKHAKHWVSVGFCTLNFLKGANKFQTTDTTWQKNSKQQQTVKVNFLIY